ncbi:hypothetical protein FGG08_003488 [Glutinoglossum americanum]|uniref:allantoinase n=1 Tax=Glutinoglossum americanum TaxID=1670608 RepID=A0A9P8L0L3_9PEZI|nr:hypothetical protein FGG08_003488 [Glutinoglossum americanum]
MATTSSGNNSNTGSYVTTPSPSTAPTTPDLSDQLSGVTVLASSRTLLSGRITEGTVVISLQTGKILSIYNLVLPESEFPLGTPYRDYSPLILLPGLVDAHVHLNEPGRTEWEGFWTGTRAAAFGGVTTVVDMPLNAIPPTTTVAGLQEKLRAAEGQCWVDVGFYGGVVPGNAGELKALVKEGVRGFKGFLIDSGDEPTVLMFHAEMIPPISDSVGDSVQISEPPLEPRGPLSSYNTFLASRPPSFETYAIEEILSLVHIAPDLPLHIVHLSAVEAIEILRNARRRGVKITAETCFHYLSLAAEHVKDGDTRHKCCPPIREKANQDGLWQELLRARPVNRTTAMEADQYANDVVLRTIVSDHSPCTAGLKLLPLDAGSGDFFAAWGGISSVGLGLPILWTECQKRKNGVTIEDIIRWCSWATAKQVGLETSKGDLKVGFDGDVVVFDDEAEFKVEPSTMLFRNKVSPYEGSALRGVVRETWVRGKRVFSRDDGFSKDGPSGKLLIEPRTKTQI